MLDTANLPTKFAPAERAPAAVVEQQSQYFAEYPLLQQVLDAVPDIFLIVNAQRQIVFANQTLLNFMRLNPEVFVNGLRPGEVLRCVHAREEEGGCGTSEFCRECGAVKAMLAGLSGEKSVQECRIMQEDGSALDLEVYATPLVVDGERFSIFAVKDISAQKRRQALERIFFHDILNTVSIISGFAEILRDATPVEIDEIKGSFYQLCRRLTDEIRAQKTLTAAENNELTVRPVRLESLALLRDIKAAYDNHDLAQGRCIEISPAARQVVFFSDTALIQRVLINMVKNALEATPEGGTVTLSCHDDDEGVAFTVHNPAFIPRKVQLQVFQRSFSTKGSDRGLGTYSMKLLTERYLHGTVSFTTSPAKGTTFIAHYPVALLQTG
ncbi:MAG: GHKL domain-containing protein [Chloroflexi bacterium]|nr:GHKL domain-containing protein [Chloroflexota bacterium]